MQQRRQRTELFVLPDRPCGLCSHHESIVTESRSVRQGIAWLNPVWSPDVELYEVCSSCSARRPLESALVASF